MRLCWVPEQPGARCLHSLHVAVVLDRNTAKMITASLLSCFFFHFSPYFAEFLPPHCFAIVTIHISKCSAHLRYACFYFIYLLYFFKYSAFFCKKIAIHFFWRNSKVSHFSLFSSTSLGSVIVFLFSHFLFLDFLLTF